MTAHLRALGLMTDALLIQFRPATQFHGGLARLNMGRQRGLQEATPGRFANKRRGVGVVIPSHAASHW
eukprot:COSAG06_NODE_6444_length_2929_cov_45.031704_2_plen_68_part_00